MKTGDASSGESFGDFVESKINRAKAIDWETKKNLWLSKVNELYGHIGLWLGDLTQSGKVSLSTDEKRSVVEEHIGPYTVPVMKIGIGDETIRLDPVGTLIIGASGRVDIKGRAGNAMLVLSQVNKSKSSAAPGAKDASNELIWKYVEKSSPPAYFDLNKPLFERILMSVSG